MLHTQYTGGRENDVKVHAQALPVGMIIQWLGNATMLPIGRIAALDAEVILSS